MECGETDQYVHVACVLRGRVVVLTQNLVSVGCDCVGYIPPVLGGGHGWLQGRYGLATDNLLSARMVLADASVIEVSENSHPDLFWGIRGAGHNFGIATEIKMRIYDREKKQDQWAAVGFTFAGEKLEGIFTVLNEWLGAKKRPVELTHYAVFGWDSNAGVVS